MSQSRDNMQGGFSNSGSSDTGSKGPEAAGAMDSMHNVSQRLRQTADQAREIADHAKEVLSDKLSTAGEQLHHVTDQLNQGVDRIRHMDRADYEELWSGVKTKARENPGQTILAAVAAGFVLGLMMRTGGRR